MDPPAVDDHTSISTLGRRSNEAPAAAPATMKAKGFHLGIRLHPYQGHGQKQILEQEQNTTSTSVFCPARTKTVGLIVCALVFLQCFHSGKAISILSSIIMSENTGTRAPDSYDGDGLPVPTINLQLHQQHQHMHQHILEQMKGHFCGSYKWMGSTKVSCEERAQYLVNRYKITEQNAMDSILEGGCQCIASADDWDTLLRAGDKDKKHPPPSSNLRDNKSKIAGGHEKSKMVPRDREPESVCFSWNNVKAADDWWTPRPWYHVTEETDDGFCFSHIEDAKKQNFMRLLAHNQFHGNCTNVISKSMTSSGWGYDFTNLADALWMGMNEMRPVQMVLTGLSGSKPGVWFYAGLKDGSKPVCQSTDMYCYMLNMTNCEAKKDKKDIIGLNREMRYLPGFELYKDWLFEYETRMQSWLRKEVYDYSNTRIHMKTPCTVIHVRRSDIKGHGGRKYHDIKDYVDNMNALGHKRLHENILLLTDDQNAIEEALREYPDKNWMYFNRTRFRGNEGGWENHFPSGDPKTEVVTLLSIYRAVTHCDSISKQSGNFGNSLLAQMERSRGNGNVTVADLGSALF